MSSKYCKRCLVEIPLGRKFCSHSCSAKENNKSRCRHGKQREVFDCLTCNKTLKQSQKKYCSKSCSQRFLYQEFIVRWLNEEEDGVVGEGMQISLHIRRWLQENFGEKCSECGWSKINQHTNKIPVQIDHIDGNPLNNKPDNLRFLCPSCHSLTATYGGANKGNGREVRRRKYKARVSSTG